MSKKILNYFFALITIILFVLTIRGNFGNPSANQIDYTLSSSGKAFETSQERSRYAIILSLVNHHRFDLGEYASMGTPDIGVSNGKYYSFFPPATSILAIPLYLLGIKYNLAQVMTFLVSTIFSLLTMYMTWRFCISNGISNSLSLFAAFAFSFSTNAWGYSVTLYAHLLSAFAVLVGLHLITKSEKTTFKDYLLVWFFYGFGIYVDFPNIFTYFPIAIVATLKMFEVYKSEQGFKLSLNIAKILGPIILLLMLSGYGYYNYIHFGNPTKMSNTISRVRDLKDVNLSSPESDDEGSDAVSALETRSLSNGLKSFLYSHDRGMLIYTPVALLSLFGLLSLKKKDASTKNLLVAIPLASLFTYSMFGDPYGGWAFGSRYMISVLPELIILAVFGMQHFLDNANKLSVIVIKLIYSLVFVYSSAVSLLAPLTTNVIPPYVEARNIGLKSDYSINIRMLQNNELNSFIYNNFAKNNLTGVQYYYLIFVLVVVVGLGLLWSSKSNINK